MRWWRRSPFGMISTTILVCCIIEKRPVLVVCQLLMHAFKLTELSRMIPNIRRIFLWLNCPMTTASWRNLTLSSLHTPSSTDFTATSKVITPSPCFILHTPRCTVPNSPLPRHSLNLEMLWEKLVAIHSHTCTHTLTHSHMGMAHAHTMTHKHNDILVTWYQYYWGARDACSGWVHPN